MVADTVGVREVVPVEDTVGLRFPSRDATALGGLPERVLTDAAGRAQLVAEAREHVLRFDWAEVSGAPPSSTPPWPRERSRPPGDRLHSRPVTACIPRR